jgi:hypothetical protein
MVIKCYPFKFFEPLVKVAKCIFVFHEDWESSGLSDSMIIRLEEGHDNLCDFESNFGGSYDYSEHESLIEVLSCGSFPKCLELSLPETAVHYNSPSIMRDRHYLGSEHMIVDFYNQNTNECSMNCKYVGVIGEDSRAAFEAISWSLTDPVISLSLEETSVEEFCKSTGQSLDKINTESNMQ